MTCFTKAGKRCHFPALLDVLKAMWWSIVVLCWAAIYTEHIFTYLYISITGISPDDLVFAER